MTRLVLIALLLSPASLFASSFELSGTILDESGIGLPGAELTLFSESSSVVRVTHTNDSGRYAFPAMAPGEYTLEARLDGFATSRFAGLRYFADTKPIFNITLRPRSVQESMTFTGEAPLINVSHAQVGLSVEERQLDELPLGGRDYLNLVDLEGAAHELRESPPGGDIFGAPLQTLSGAGAHYTSYQLDGFANTRDQHGVVHVDVDVDAVEEFRVISGQSSAGYGESLGGIVSATTRAGEQDFHGSVFFYLRPGSWDASDPLTGAMTTLDRQEIGFTLSGPLGPLDDARTQFFTSFSYLQQDEDVVVTAPYDNDRFAGLFTLPSERFRLLAKLTHFFNPNHDLSIKAAFSNLDTIDGVGGFDIFDNRRETRNDDLAIHAALVSVFGGAVSELRVGFSSERFRADGVAPPLETVRIYPTEGNIGNPTLLDRVDEDHFVLSETLSLSAGNHRIKTGFSFLRIESDSELVRFSDGLLHFAPGENEAPILFWQSVTATGAETRLERSESHLQLFFQDDWQLTPFFTVNLGLRWQKESSVPGNNNFAPRFGFHWDATRDGRTSVRAGYGVFHSFVFSIVDSLERLYGPGGRRVLATSPGAVPSAEAFHFYLDAPVFAESARRTPYAQHVTMGVEREIAPTWTAALDVSYIRGSNLILPVDVNAPSFFDYTGGTTRSASAADATRPFGVPGSPIPPGVAPELPDGYPIGGYRDLYLLASRGSSRFWGMKLNVTKRYATDFTIQAVYHWSRSENDGDDFRITESLPLDPANRDGEWGRSAVDIPNALVVNGVWDAPLGFRLTGIARYRSGRTVDPRVDDDLDGDLKLRERASSPGRVLERNSFRARSVAGLDISIGKSWEVGEGRRIVAALDIFNLTNRLNPKQFLRSFGANAASPLPSFLEIVQASPPRQFQLSVRFAF